MSIRQFIKNGLPQSIVDGIKDRRNAGIVAFEKTRYEITARKITRAGSSYFIPDYALHRPACSEMLADRFYEPQTHQLIPLILKETGGNMVHAGAFFGDMLPSFAATGARIYAFEPVLENYVLARLCVIENNLANVMLFHAALGEAPGTARMDTGDKVHLGGASSLSDSGQLTTLLSLDSVSPADVSIIQFDTEGSELTALKGCVKTIERDSPIIMIEDNECNCADFLKGLGYVRAGSIPGLEVWTKGKPIPVLKAYLHRARD